jgi:hypothetical protein
MKLTESKLKNLINEVLNENKQHAKKIFDLLSSAYDGYGERENDEFFNQAVSLAIATKLVNDVLALINEKLNQFPGWEYYRDYDQGYSAVYRSGLKFSKMKKDFMDQVAKDVGSMTKMQIQQKQEI